VSRVAVLGLAQYEATHFFRCSSNSTPASQLEWVKGGQSVKFDTRVTSDLLMDMARPVVMEEDEGDYTCRDTVTQEQLTIFISAGKGRGRAGWGTL